VSLSAAFTTIFRRCACALVLLAGCQAGYVLKQAAHQISLPPRQIELDDPRLAEKLSPETIEKLRWVPRVLDFCRDELALDPGDAYQSYLDTEGKPVAHAVTASHPLALLPYLWHFPFVGTVPYKGFFDEEDARAESRRLAAMGYDTAVQAVGGFSTLGWFRDPVLSTMLEGSISDLADVIIHEATHRTLYFSGQAVLSESLATHMAREGTVRFLHAWQELEGQLPAYLAARKSARHNEDLLARLRDDLDALYRTRIGDEEKKARKAEIFATASGAFERRSPDAGIPPSNAVVLSVTRYHDLESLLGKLQLFRGGQPCHLMAYLKELRDVEDPVRAIREELGRLGAEVP
jgi:predicted aminopeptidase